MPDFKMGKAQAKNRRVTNRPSLNKYPSLIVKLKIQIVRKESSGLLDPQPRGRCVAIAQSNAQTSPLLRLPPELRNRIFVYVLGGTLIIARSKRFAQTRKLQSLVAMTKDDRLRLDFLQVCRSIYAEARLIPFTANIFSISLHRSLLHPSKTLLPVQLAAITTAEIRHNCTTENQSIFISADGLTKLCGLRRANIIALYKSAELDKLKATGAEGDIPRTVYEKLLAEVIKSAKSDIKTFIFRKKIPDKAWGDSDEWYHWFWSVLVGGDPD